MRNFFKIVFIGTLLLSLNACSYIYGNKSYYTRQKDAYLTSKAVSPIKLANGQSIVGQQDYYMIPSVSGKPNANLSLVPPGSLSAYEVSHNIKSSKQLTAIPVVSKGQVLLRKDGSGYPYLLMQESLNSAWTDVGKALDATDFKINSKNNINYTYFVSEISTSLNSKQAPQNYELQLIPQSSSTKIIVTNDKGAHVSVSQAEAVLTALQDDLLGRQPLPHQTFWQEVF